MALLLQAGADMTLRESQGRSCLHRACESSNVACLHYLLTHGGDIHDVDSSGHRHVILLCECDVLVCCMCHVIVTSPRSLLTCCPGE